MYLQRHKGIALVAAVMLMVFATIAVFGVVTFITQRLTQQPTEEAFLKAIYLAQAGLNYAIYQYRSSATLYSGTVSNIDGSGGYAVVATSSGGGGGSGQAALLSVDATGSYLGGSGSKDILGITLTNTSLSSSIRLDYFTISVIGGSKTLSQININGSSVWTTNTSIGSTPVTLNMTDVTIPANTTRVVNFIRWTSGMSGRTVNLSFTMSDGNATTLCQVYPASPACSGTLSIKSMGQPAGSSVYRTVQATYDTASGTITSCTETNDTVP